MGVRMQCLLCFWSRIHNTFIFFITYEWAGPNKLKGGLSSLVFECKAGAYPFSCSTLS
jgi:hypothetical protein